MRNLLHNKLLSSDYYYFKMGRKVFLVILLTLLLFGFLISPVYDHLRHLEWVEYGYEGVQIALYLWVGYLGFLWHSAKKRAATLGGFVCPRCLYELEVPEAIDIDLVRPGRKGTMATQTSVYCPECDLTTIAADLFRHWWIGPFDPVKRRKARGFFWPLNRWWAVVFRNSS